MKRVANEIAGLIVAIKNCEISGNQEWHRAQHRDRLKSILRNYLPSGCGFDNGTEIDIENSSSEKLVFHTSFHHMNENGMYDGWTEHKITVKPSFFGLNISVSGRNRNDIKDFIAEEFLHRLEGECNF